MRQWGTALALLTLGLSACAPLEPESRRATSEPSVSVAPSTPGQPRPEQAPVQEPVPDITVPPGIEDVRPARGPVLGGDVSWPQCPTGMGIPERRSLGLPMPVPEARYVVIGLTNGPGFTSNPCVESQLAWVAERELLVSAYSVLTAPYGDQLRRYGVEGPYAEGTRLDAMRNVGFAQARYNIATLQRIGLRTPIVWLDVEPVPGFDWSDDLRANAAVVEGAARGYVEAGYLVGVYSTQYLWAQIVGDLRLGAPEWRTAGQTSRAEAARRCGPDASIQGGTPVISQWLRDDRDFNITCTGIAGRLSDYFVAT